jgi:acetyl esterase/lipase
MKITKLPPAVAFLDRRYRHVTHSVRYSGSQHVDIWGEPGSEPAPIMIFVPGGAWASGKRATCQGHALMTRMVGLGWMCLSIDYRTAPQHRWPAPLDDVRDAVFWAHDHAEEIGGDPNFITIAGASAGGHLASLVGLTPGMVDAAVAIYASYDWVDRSTLWRKVFMEYIERVVVGRSFHSCPHTFLDASPMHQINPFAAPTMIVHGTKDVLIRVDEAREFHHRLSGMSEAAVEYLEVPGAVHGFDMVNVGQTIIANRAIADFLGHQRSLALGLIESAS